LTRSLAFVTCLIKDRCKSSEKKEFIEHTYFCQLIAALNLTDNLETWPATWNQFLSPSNFLNIILRDRQTDRHTTPLKLAEAVTNCTMLSAEIRETHES